MTQKQFNQTYKEMYPYWFVYTLTDRRVRYNDLMESEYRDGRITSKQRQNWGHPKFLESNKHKINCNAY